MRPQILIIENEDEWGDETYSLSTLVRHIVEPVIDVRICNAPVDSPFDRLNGCCGIILGGSSASVNQYKDKSWIRRETEFILEAIDHDVPVLGLCFGHQLIAKAFGASIAGMGWDNYGFAEVETLCGDDLFDGLAPHFTAPVYHYEQIITLPGSLEIIALSRGVPVMGFRHPRRAVWGVQFHPEITSEICRHRGGFPKEWRWPSNFEEVRSQKVLLNFVRLATVQD